jgi:hypothetical protein
MKILTQFGIFTRIMILIIGSMEELTPIYSSEKHQLIDF